MLLRDPWDVEKYNMTPLANDLWILARGRQICLMCADGGHKRGFLGSRGLTEMMVTNAARFGTDKAAEPLRRVNAAGTRGKGSRDRT
jgi:hypothetical protein